MSTTPEAPRRGFNPQPPEGWSWSLTDYEAAYVVAFGVRPHREEWEASADQIESLQQEANYLLQQKAARPSAGEKSAKTARAPHKRGMPLLVVAIVSLVFVGLSATAVTFAISNLEHLDTLEQRLLRIEGQVDLHS